MKQLAFVLLPLLFMTSIKETKRFRNWMYMILSRIDIVTLSVLEAQDCDGAFASASSVQKEKNLSLRIRFNLSENLLNRFYIPSHSKIENFIKIASASAFTTIFSAREM